MLMPLLITHITCAVIALFAGFMAMGFRKGSGLHGAAGTVFFVSMIGMTTSAGYLAAFVKPNRLNLIAASLTFYLVVTAWRAAKRRVGGTSLFDAAALVFVMGVAVMAFAAGLKGGIFAAPSLIFGCAAVFCAITDVRMLRRGGLAGPQRIVRHLWRMSMALLIAALSFYPGQAKLFPMWLRETKLLLLPMLVVIVSAFYWRHRVTRRKRVSQEVTSETVHQNPAIASAMGAAGVI